MAGEWNTTLPVDHTLISDLPNESRKITAKVKTVIQKEHRALGDGNSGGEHTQGSAISFFLPTASAPTTDPAGTAFVTADLGRLWFDTTTSELKVLVAIGPVVWKIIPTTAAAILLISTLDVAGDFSVATNKFNVTAASGNTAVAGTLDVTGNTDPTTYETTNGGFLDEDDMSSDAADKVASQQSIKKYVDDKVLIPVNGTPTAVTRVILTGTTDNDASTTVNISGATTIYSAIAMITDGTNYRGQDNGNFEIAVNGANVLFNSVNANVQGKTYRLVVEYV